MSGSIYDLLAANHGTHDGPSSERVATVFEVVRGHGAVLADFLARPGRWHLFIEVDRSQCLECGNDEGRYLQFAILEDGRSMVGECSSNTFLDDPFQLTLDHELALVELGWRMPDERVPNWHLEATTDDEMAHLAEVSCATLTKVFGLDDRHRVTVRFCERMLAANESA